MSTVVAFTPARSRRNERPLARVVPIGAAHGGRAGARHPSEAGRGAQPAHERPVVVDVDWSRVAPSPLRLTRRGRLVAGVLAAIVLAVVIGTAVALLGHQALAGDQVQPVTSGYRIVLPGETLWSIAGEVAPSEDRRDTVARIVEFNALDSAGVQAGQRVAIPSDLAAH